MPICNKTIDLALSTQTVSGEEKFDKNVQKLKKSNQKLKCPFTINKPSKEYYC